jgi:hypothetical protein
MPEDELEGDAFVSLALDSILLDLLLGVLSISKSEWLGGEGDFSTDSGPDLSEDDESERKLNG